MSHPNLMIRKPGRWGPAVCVFEQDFQVIVMHMKFENHSGCSLKSPGEHSNTLIPRWHPQNAEDLVSQVPGGGARFYVQLGLRAKL